MNRTMKVGVTDYIEFEVSSSNVLDTIVITETNCEFENVEDSSATGIEVMGISSSGNIISILVKASKKGNYEGKLSYSIAPVKLIDDFLVEVV